MEINFFETFLNEIFIDWNYLQKETFMKMDFKILREYFIKILFENYSYENFKIFMLVFSYHTRFLIRK